MGVFVCTARQMARLRCGYVSCNVFLHRHGLATTTDCHYCRLHLGSQILDSTSHAFCQCPQYAYYNVDFHQGAARLLSRDNLSLLDILRPPRHTSLALRISSLILAHVTRIRDYYCF